MSGSQHSLAKLDGPPRLKGQLELDIAHKVPVGLRVHLPLNEVGRKQRLLHRHLQTGDMKLKQA